VPELVLLVVAGLLIAANGVFVAAEFSMVTVDRANVEARERAGDHRAGGVLKALRTLSFQLSGAQLGITVTSLVVGFLAEPALASLLRGPLTSLGLPAGAAAPLAVVIAMLVATVLQMVFGELVPKNLAIARPYAVAATVIGFQRGFSLVMTPLIRGLNAVANRLIRLLRVQPQEELRSARSPQELASLTRRSAEAGTLPDRVASLVHRTLQFGDRTAGDVMTPRSRLDTLNATDDVGELLALARETGHSRFPVCGDGLDDVVGVVHIRQAIAVQADRRAGLTVGELATAPLRVPDSLPLERLFPQMRGRGRHLAVLIDEYGGTAGIVTLEDLLEELVGEVRDEHDPERLPAVTAVDGGWELSGLLRLDEVAVETSVELPDGPYDTVAGLIVQRLGRLAHVGDTVDAGGVRLVVTRVEGRRIERVRLET
jgi:CBS domain containing-hemolysin-like protein